MDPGPCASELQPACAAHWLLGPCLLPAITECVAYRPRHAERRRASRHGPGPCLHLRHRCGVWREADHLNWVPGGPELLTPADHEGDIGRGLVTLLWSPVAGLRPGTRSNARGGSGPYAVVATVGAPLYRDSSPIGGRAYYRVRAFCRHDDRASSETISTILVPAPAPESGWRVRRRGARWSHVILGATATTASAGVQARGSRPPASPLHRWRASTYRSSSRASGRTSARSWGDFGYGWMRRHRLDSQLAEGTYRHRVSRSRETAAWPQPPLRHPVCRPHRSISQRRAGDGAGERHQPQLGYAGEGVAYSAYRVSGSSSALTLAVVGIDRHGVFSTAACARVGERVVIARSTMFGNEGP